MAGSFGGECVRKSCVFPNLILRTIGRVIQVTLQNNVLSCGHVFGHGFGHGVGFPKTQIAVAGVQVSCVHDQFVVIGEA